MLFSGSSQIVLLGKGLIDTSIHEGVLYTHATPYLWAIRHASILRANASNSAKYISEARLQRPGASTSTVAPAIGQHTSYASSGYVESCPMDDMAGNGDH